MLVVTVAIVACDRTTRNDEDLLAGDPDGPVISTAHGAFSTSVVPICAATVDFVSGVDFMFTDAQKKVWKAPAGTRTNGLSIPQSCMSLVGSPVRNESLGAALVHDAYCGRANAGRPNYQGATWQEVHRMFYEACLAGGTPAQRAKAMYTAVYLCGPRWPESEKLNRVQLTNRIIQAQFFIPWIKKHNPSIDTLVHSLSRVEQRLKQTNGRVDGWLMTRT